MNNMGLPIDVWTKQWVEFTGYYEKNMVDIILKNGDQVDCCWPNAGFMNPWYEGNNPKGYKEIPYEDVKMVRLTHNSKWDK